MLQAKEFWQYSLGIYGLNKIKQQCLLLQNSYGLNVNMLLLCGFLTHHEIYLGAGIFTKLNQTIEKIDQQLKALRTKRIAIKYQQPQLYLSLLEQELTIEKSQQAELILGLNNLLNNGVEFNDQQKDNFTSYYHSLEKDDKQILADIIITKAIIVNV